MEIYYFYSLPELGLQEVSWALEIASALNDKDLLIDAYNFRGLFYLMLDQKDETIFSFSKGVSYISKQYIPHTFYLTQPQHIYANLAEAYEKFGMLDSALKWNKQSFYYANIIGSNRSKMIASFGIGNVYSKLLQMDSAKYYLNKALTDSKKAEQSDIYTMSMVGLANMFRFDNVQSKRLLNDVLDVFSSDIYINHLYATYILDEGINLCKIKKFDFLLHKFEDKKNGLNQSIFQQKSKYLETLSKYHFNNELALVSNELVEVEYQRYKATTRLYFVLALLGILGAAFLAYRYYINQKLKVADVRHQISQDLHDEVGSTLSALALTSDLALSQIQNDKSDKKIEYFLKVLRDHSRNTLSTLSDIVWVVNTKGDTFSEVVERIRKSCLDVARLNNISLLIRTDEKLIGCKMNMKWRKNVYLICKEIISNSIKYSSAKELSLKFEYENRNRIRIEIKDNGQGFDENNVDRGNGLQNISDRIAELKGEYKMTTGVTGTQYLIFLKIPN